MFSKNLKYYRLKKNLTKKELANLVHVSSMAITYYENGQRMPSMEIIKSLAEVLEVKTIDFLSRRDENLVFYHGSFRKSDLLTKQKQDFIIESVEEYFNRLYLITEILGGDPIGEPFKTHTLELSSDSWMNALKMRKHLALAPEGPLASIVTMLESKGVLIYMDNFGNDGFFGLNGFVNQRPYIVVNKNMTNARIRSTIVHELVHLLFNWNNRNDDKEIEETVAEITRDFLFSKNDVRRELGLKRNKITKDMLLVCDEYGISMEILVKQAYKYRIINQTVYREFFNRDGHPLMNSSLINVIEKEPILLKKLVYRAVCEEIITIQKGSELLKEPYLAIERACFVDEAY